MRKIREVLRLKHECCRSQREIAAACNMSASTVSEYLLRAARSGLTWDAAREFSDAEVEQLLFTQLAQNEPSMRKDVDCSWIHSELRRHGVTLQLLWEEYAAGATDGRPYQYSQFCDIYARWRKRLRLSMRQVHRAGEKVFVDYSGKRPRIVDPATGEVRDVELFVAVLGASSYTFAEATFTQTVGDFVVSCVRALEFFGASPEIIVPDQLRSAVARPDRYDPDINQTFLEFAQHYGMSAIPAPPRKPKGKAKVEVGVLVVQRWVLARLRNRTFFSLAELNAAIRVLLDELNARPLAKLDESRRDLFLRLDRPAMRALPVTRFEAAERATRRVNVDYCVEFDRRFYSVPCALRGTTVEVRASRAVVDIWSKGVRVASHPRNYERHGAAIIAKAHRPKEHEDYGEWPPERFLSWAAKFGNAVEEVVRRTLSRYPRPEMGYRPALGILRLAERHGSAAMNAACDRALANAGSSAPHRQYIAEILKRGLHRDISVPPPTRVALRHENVRGGPYFDQEEDREQRRDNSKTH
jgi:transposase